MLLRQKLIPIITLLLLCKSVSYGQELYDINTIQEIKIYFDESNWDSILDSYAQAGDDERLTGTVEINGISFTDVGVRYKGNSSYSSDRIKNPLNIKLDYLVDQKYDGYGTIKLSNGFKDPSFIREVYSYELARQYMPAPRSNFAKVWINDSYMGLYTSNQDVDKYFCRQNYGEDEGIRIKGEISNNTQPGQMGGVWQYFSNDSSDYFSKYKIESDYGWNQLVAFLDTLNYSNQSLDKVLNIDRQLWFTAFSNLLVNLDGPLNNPQNYYIYSDEEGRFNIIPWDLNESFGGFTNLQSSMPLNTSQLQEFSPYVNTQNSDYPILSEILNNDLYKKIYIAHYRTIFEENFANGAYLDRICDLQSLIDQEVYDDPNKFYTYSDFTNSLNSSIGFGPNGVIGVDQLMGNRISYLNSTADFNYVRPSISNLTFDSSSFEIGSEHIFQANISDANTVYLYFRKKGTLKFTSEEMYDDGLHDDIMANDGIYGCSLTAGSAHYDFYIFAENYNAVRFSPERAEFEFYSNYENLNEDSIDIEDHKTLELVNVFPNPFHESTNIIYYIDKIGSLKVSVYSIDGKLIQQKDISITEPGEYEYQFSRNGVSSGIYYFQIRFDEYILSDRLVIQ